MARSWEFKRVVWWPVHRVFNNSRYHNRNDFHSSLDSFVNLLTFRSFRMRIALPNFSSGKTSNVRRYNSQGRRKTLAGDVKHCMVVVV